MQVCVIPDVNLLLPCISWLGIRLGISIIRSVGTIEQNTIMCVCVSSFMCLRDCLLP